MGDWTPGSLKDALLLHAVVDDNRGNTGRHLRNDIGDRVIGGNAAIEERGRRDRGVEVAAADAADQECKDRQGRTDRQGIARGDDYGDKNESSDELNEDRQRVHEGGFLLRNGNFCTDLDSVVYEY